MWLLVVIAILPLSKCARCQHNYCDPEDATEWYDKHSKYTLKYGIAVGWAVGRVGTEIGFQIDIHIALG